MRKAAKAFQTSTPVSHDHEVMVLVRGRIEPLCSEFTQHLEEIAYACRDEEMIWRLVGRPRSHCATTEVERYTYNAQ
jgi:hypothetical protein